VALSSTLLGGGAGRRELHNEVSYCTDGGGG